MSKKRRKPATPQESGHRLPGLVERYGGRALAGILIVYIALSLLLFDPKPFVGGDNAAYVALSKSLVQGSGLTELWTPEQRPHTQYPFGFPMMLAPIAMLKLPYVWYKLIPWLSGLAGILLTWLLLKKEGKASALAVCLLLAVNPHYLEFSHWVLSELPFLALTILSLWLFSCWESKGGTVWFVASVLAVSACIHVRSAGLALLAAITIHLAAQGRHRWALLFLGAGIALMVPWALRNAHYGTSGGYLEQFLMRDPYQPELGRIGAGELAGRIAQNLRLYLTSIWPQLVLPGIVEWGLGQAWLLWLVLLSVPAVFGATAGIKKHGAAGWLVFCYLCLSLLWPEAWSDRRFALPLLPLLLFFLLQGYHFLIHRMLINKATVVAAGLLLFLILGNLAPVLGMIGPSIESQIEYRRGDRLAGYDPRWRGFFMAAEWVRNNTPESAIVVSRKPQLFYLASGRRSFCYPFIVNADSMTAALSKAEYVMVEPVSGTVQRYLMPAVEPFIGTKYSVIYSIGNPPTYVLKINKETGNAR